jgi:hypothetical protein
MYDHISKITRAKRLEVEHLPSKQEAQTPVQKQVGCGWHMSVVPATQEEKEHSWHEQKHETFSEKQMKTKRNPEPGSSCRDLKFNLKYGQKSKTALKQTNKKL